MPMSASSPTTTPAPIEALWPTVTLAPRVVGAGAEEEEEEEAEFSMSSGVVRTVAPSWTLVSSPMMTGAPSPEVLGGLKGKRKGNEG
jgi:hypothetical protein